MKIETKSGHTILADDADYPLLLQYSWFVQRTQSGNLYAYAHISGCGASRRRTSMHRLLMSPPAHLVVHHKNDNGLDNRRSNLEVTTHRQNIRYAYPRGSVFRQGKKWRVQVRDETGRQSSLGSFDTEEVARAALKDWNYGP